MGSGMIVVKNKFFFILSLSSVENEIMPPSLSFIGYLVSSLHFIIIKYTNYSHKNTKYGQLILIFLDDIKYLKFYISAKDMSYCF